MATHGGRHRFGTPGLQHCQDMPAVRGRLGHGSGRPAPAHRAPAMPGHRSGLAVAIAVAVTTGAVVAANWATTATTAFAGIIGHR